MKFKGQVDIEDLSKLLIQKQSQAGQDLFVIAMTQGKKNGTFLELGGYHPFEISNTYVLEKMFGWDGWSVDLVDNSLDLNTFEERIWNRFYQDVKDSMWPPVGTKFKDLPKYIQLELINIHNYKKKSGKVKDKLFFSIFFYFTREPSVQFVVTFCNESFISTR